jgi:hypothetical protein
MRAGLAIGFTMLLGAAATVLAADYPPRKPGLWELTRSSPNPRYPLPLQQICLDAATDALLYKFGMSAGRQTCSKFDVQSAGGKVQVDAVCKLGATTTSSHSVITFSGDTAYHENISLHYDPPLMGKTSDSSATTDARWMGTCPSDMKPGDIVTKPSPLMPIPMRMNIRDMLNDGH